MGNNGLLRQRSRATMGNNGLLRQRSRATMGCFVSEAGQQWATKESQAFNEAKVPQ